jgi:hypothetical protein
MGGTCVYWVAENSVQGCDGERKRTETGGRIKLDERIVLKNILKE